MVRGRLKIQEKNHRSVVAVVQRSQDIKLGDRSNIEELGQCGIGKQRKSRTFDLFPIRHGGTRYLITASRAKMRAIDLWLLSGQGHARR
jgi:hypothetical protein